jgi:hypothetical protein
MVDKFALEKELQRKLTVELELKAMQLEIELRQKDIEIYHLKMQMIKNTI